DAAVQHAENVLARVCGGDPLDGGDDSVAHHGVRLAALPAVAAVDVPAKAVGVARLDLGRRQAGPLADVDLAQRGIGGHRQALRAADDLGGVAGATDVARAERIEPDVRAMSGAPGGLAATGVR